MRGIKLGIAAVVAVLLAGCAGGTVYNSQFHANYRHLDVMAEHGGKDMKLEVLGAPAGADEATIADAVGAAMSGRNWGQPITFTPTPQETIGSPARIVVMFSPKRNALGRQVCDGTAAPSAEGSPSAAIVAYCRRDIQHSSLWIDLPEGAAPGSEAFNDSFALVTHALLPLRSPFDPSKNSNLCVGAC